ncbi:MAG: hypothetical protein IJQ21_13690 [Lachnospiraceae bacterium]|nr:hypothetical protein [Lachnospiraceae bacterium]
MKQTYRRSIAILLLVLMPVLSACGAGTGSGAGGDTTAQTDVSVQTAGGAGETSPAGETGSTADAAPGEGDTADSETGENTAYTAYLPIAVQYGGGRHEVANGEYLHEIYEEYPVLSVGEYEWGGTIAPPEDRRYDALESRLNMLNEQFAAGGGTAWLKQYLAQEGVTESGSVGSHGFINEYNGNITMYDRTRVQVTRADEKAVSLLVSVRSDALLSAIPVFYGTYVIDPETGKDIRLKSVVTDMDQFSETLLQLAEEAFPDTAFTEELQDADRAISLAEEMWTLDYDGVTVYAPLELTGETENVPCVTLPFATYPQLFDEAYTGHPESYLTEMLAGRTYRHPGSDDIIRLDHEAVTDTDTVPQHPLTLTIGEKTFSDHYAKNYPPHYLVCHKDRYYILMDPPAFDISAEMYRYDLNDGDVKEPERLEIRIGTPVSFNPAHMLFYEDALKNGDAVDPALQCVAFVYYRMDENGEFVCDEDARFLEGNAELTARQQVETLGYRRHDEGTLVNKTITRGMKLRPYRTDRKTFIEFESGGDIFRFDMEGYGADMKLNDVFTIANLFEV